MRSTFRKLTLAVHIALSVGWLGGIVAYLTLVAAAKLNLDAELLRAVWTVLPVIGWYALVPLAAGSLLSGVIIALGTPWGLFRHYWVLVSLALTTLSAAVLFQHMRTVSAFVASDVSTIPIEALRSALNGEVLHAGLGLVVLLLVLGLNVYKPQGLTAFGQRTASRTEQSAASAEPAFTPLSAPGTPLWLRIVAAHAIGVAVLLAIVHIVTRGPGQH